MFEHELKNAYIGEYSWQPGANTLAYWKFDGNTSSGFVGGATLSGTPYGYTTGLLGQALQSTNSKTLSSSLTQGDVFHGAFAIAFCAKMLSSQTLQRFFRAPYNVGIDIQYEFYNDFSGFNVYNNSASPQVRIAFPLTNPGQGVWKKLVLTGDGINQIELYVDGTKVTPYSNYNTTFAYPNYTSYNFGIQGADSTNVALDEVVVENKHWKQSDVDSYLMLFN